MKNDKSLKKAEIRKMEQTMIKRKKLNMLIGGIFAVVIISVLVVVGASMIGVEKTDYIESNIQSDEDILIPVADLSETANFYSFDSNGIDIRYFAAIGADGEVHVALDACDSCYDAKKGYRQEDDNLHCINCGREFPLVVVKIDDHLVTRDKYNDTIVPDNSKVAVIHKISGG